MTLSAARTGPILAPIAAVAAVPASKRAAARRVIILVSLLFELDWQWPLTVAREASATQH
jgi:hypothetical protein